MKALVDSGAPVITIVGKTSDFHVTEVLARIAGENLAMIGETIAWLRSQDRDVIYRCEHFFDGTKAIATTPCRRGRCVATVRGWR